MTVIVDTGVLYADHDEAYDDQGLSFTDATTVAVCERHGIDSVMSFDDDFDGVFERVDPETI